MRQVLSLTVALLLSTTIFAQWTYNNSTTLPPLTDSYYPLVTDYVNGTFPVQAAAGTNYQISQHYETPWQAGSETPIPTLSAGESVKVKIAVPPGVVMGYMTITSNDWQTSAPFCGTINYDASGPNEVGQNGDFTQISNSGYQAFVYGSFSNQIPSDSAFYMYLVFKAANANFSITTIDITYKFKDGLDSLNLVNYNAWVTAGRPIPWTGVVCEQGILTAGSITGTQTICNNTDAAPFTSTESAVGNSGLTYQWQWSADNTTWYDYAGATNEELDLPALDYGVTSATAYNIRRKATDCSGEVFSNQIVLLVDVCSGINKIENNSIHIYPNPAVNQITINNIPNNAKNIKIIDITGETVISLSKQEVNQVIDISNLQNGVYFVKVGAQVQKLIKK